MKSQALIKQVHYLLRNKGIKSTVTQNFQKIQINGFDNCKKFNEVIGFSNYRHNKKLKNLV